MSTLFPSSCHPRLISALPCRLLAGNETTRRCPAGSEAPLAGEGLAFIAWREAGLLPCPPPSSLLSYLVSLPVLSPLSRRSPSMPVTRSCLDGPSIIPFPSSPKYVVPSPTRPNNSYHPLEASFLYIRVQRTDTLGLNADQWIRGKRSAFVGCQISFYFFLLFQSVVLTIITTTQRRAHMHIFFLCRVFDMQIRGENPIDKHYTRLSTHSLGVLFIFFSLWFRRAFFCSAVS